MHFKFYHTNFDNEIKYCPDDYFMIKSGHYKIETNPETIKFCKNILEEYIMENCLKKFPENKIAHIYMEKDPYKFIKPIITEMFDKEENDELNYKIEKIKEKYKIKDKIREEYKKLI